ncbi:Sec-independent protein translocase protein TatB [Sphingomonas japonica]|uniref:Sec-independent protein translocase protein TatB n=1 Tax=Sphingomonas japonica TaxID=511662 RepID=A0ABX0TY84_9SPHN|nr:Sec-independent protein translocase protein TatB [Sphingomonas japonica]NIJ22810.1 sec-independent protein translocase protein TatB [Sphingomonas japonica]
MLDFNPTEFLVVGIVALLVIGPKDLPKAMRFVGQWVGKARGIARQFRSGFDSMMREAELAEMEKKWAEENARIMRDFPQTSDPLAPAPKQAALEAPAAERAAPPLADDARPADSVERPVIHDATAAPAAGDKPQK